MVVVPCHVFLCLLNYGLSLFGYYLHLLCELVYHLQPRGVLPRFKAYIGGLFHVKQEQSLLGRGMYVVVILEFHY